MQIFVNSNPHPDKQRHNAAVDGLEADGYLRFFRSNPELLSEQFTQVMRAVPTPPDGGFDDAEAIIERALGKGYHHQQWNAAIRGVAEPLCRSLGFQKMPVVNSAAWVNILVDDVRIGNRWYMRLRPAFCEALAVLGVWGEEICQQQEVQIDLRRLAAGI